MEKRKPIAGDEREYLNRGWSRADRLLRRVYKELGPKEIYKEEPRPFPMKKFAAMTEPETRIWDGLSDHDRRLMHRIAKHLEG